MTSVHAEKLTTREEKGGATRGGMGRGWRGRAPELGVTQRVGRRGSFTLTSLSNTGDQNRNTTRHGGNSEHLRNDHRIIIHSLTPRTTTLPDSNRGHWCHCLGLRVPADSLGSILQGAPCARGQKRHG